MISPRAELGVARKSEPAGSFGDGEILSAWHCRAPMYVYYIVVENAATGDEHSQSILDDERNSVAEVAS